MKLNDVKKSIIKICNNAIKLVAAAQKSNLLNTRTLKWFNKNKRAKKKMNIYMEYIVNIKIRTKNSFKQ